MIDGVHVGPGVLQTLEVTLRGVPPGEHMHGSLPGLLEQRRTGSQLGPGVDQEPPRRAEPRRHETHREPGIVRPERPGAHQDGIEARAQSVNLPLGLGARDPTAAAGGGGDLAVERQRELEGDVGNGLRGRVEEGGVLMTGLPSGPHGAHHLDPGLSHPYAAAPGDLARIGRAEHHPTDSGLDHRHRAGRSLSLVVARLQGYVGGRSFRSGPGGLQGDDLGVRSSELPVVPFSDDRPIPRQHASDQGVGVHVAPPLSRQQAGPVQQRLVSGREVGGLGHGQIVRRAARLV
ncbi:MAG: hypothetical protein P8170_06825 [Gemmatimonadota bacterium]